MDATTSAGRAVAERWRGARRSQERRAHALARVRAESGRLRTGLYLPAGPTVWRRLGTPLPAHLHVTKGRDARTLRRRLLDGARSIVRPTAFHVGGQGAGPDGYPIVVATYDGGTLLLDPAGGTVARVRAVVDPDADAFRRRLGRYVATPRFETEEDGRVLVEEFVEGSSVLDLSPDRLEGVVRQLTASWTRLTAGEGEGTWDSLLASTFAACADLELPEEIGRIVGAGVPDRALGLPLVPAATDATLRNIVLRHGAPVLIDLGDVRLEPFISYPLGALIDGGPDLLRRYADGHLDDSFGALARAARTTWPLAPWTRIDALAVRTCLVTAQEVGTDPAQLADGIRRRWAPVAQALRTA